LMTDTAHRQHGRRCVCQICTCGQHRCVCGAAEPPSRFEGVTSYMDDYIKYPVTPRRAMMKPPSNRQEPPRFEGQTQYQADYTKKSLPKQEPVHQNLNLVVGHHAPFVGDTTYASHYKTPPAAVRPKRRPDQGPPPERGGDDRDFGTAYRADYYEKPLPRGCPVLDLPAYPRGCSPGRSHCFWDPKRGEWV
jgi:hypothetical protein